jgi:hypothetical protein
MYLVFLKLSIRAHFASTSTILVDFFCEFEKSGEFLNCGAIMMLFCNLLTPALPMVAAEQFGLPLLRAFLQNSSDVSKGVNFAVGSATAIDVGFYERNKLVRYMLLNNSLDVQLGWFEELKPSICNTRKGR